MTKRETKREKELRLLRNQLARMEASREAAIKMLVRAEVQLPGLRRVVKRLTEALLKREAAPVKTMTYEVRPQDGNGGVDRQLVTAPAPQEDDIPGFLRRGMEAQAAADRIAAAAVQAELDAEKKRKTERRIEKLKIGQEHKQAELTGARRKMPLSGKAALAAIKARPSAG